MAHSITADEISRLETVHGFTIKTTTTQATEDFINSEFPGLELFGFIDAVLALISTMTTVNVRKELVIDARDPKRLIISYISDDGNDEVTGLAFQRTFLKFPTGIQANHDYLVLPEAFRKSGTSKKVLALCLQQYLNIGVKKIYVHAGFQNGGFVWAKAGFKAIRREHVTKILADAKAKVSDKEFGQLNAIYDGFHNKSENNAKPFPMNLWARLTCGAAALNGADWEGEIDLTNANELTNFRKYVSG